jgi:hypothetical protein
VTEYGIFNDEGCVESGFYSREEAEAAVIERYPDDTTSVCSICPDHPEQAHDTCEECNTEEDVAGCGQFLPRTVGDVDCGTCGHSAHEHLNLHTGRREG